MANNIREAPVPFFLKPITRNIADRLTSLYIGPNIDMNFHFLETHVRPSEPASLFPHSFEERFLRTNNLLIHRLGRRAGFRATISLPVMS